MTKGQECIVRLYFNADQNGENVDYSEVICKNKEIAESHILGSIYPNGEYIGGKIFTRKDIDYDRDSNTNIQNPNNGQ